LQIVKALLSLVLSSTILVHHSSLLKAVRTVYNVFLLSSDPVNQMVAQGGLTQMVHHVFTRCKVSAAIPVSESVHSTVSQDGIRPPSLAREANEESGEMDGPDNSEHGLQSELQNGSEHQSGGEPYSEANGEHINSPPASYVRIFLLSPHSESSRQRNRGREKFCRGTL
jgi:brefeldin A-inhibited guanine nucleotide-exchange protein